MISAATTATTQTATSGPGTGRTTADSSTTPEEVLGKPEMKVEPKAIPAQTLSPEGSTVSSIASSQETAELHHEVAPVQEAEAPKVPGREIGMSNGAAAGKKHRLEHEEKGPIEGTQPKLAKMQTENNLSAVDQEANAILKELNETLQRAEKSLDQIQTDDERSVVVDLMNSLTKSKSLILKLNLDKNLFKFQINSELEQHNIEKQILIRNLETFKTNLSSLVAENTTLNEKNLKLIKYYKNLKYGKFKDLKLKNSKLVKKLETYKSQSSNPNSHSESSSGRNSIVASQSQYSESQQSSKNMLNTLGMLASQVLANEEPSSQQSKGLPPTFGNNNNNNNSYPP